MLGVILGRDAVRAAARHTGLVDGEVVMDAMRPLRRVATAIAAVHGAVLLGALAFLDHYTWFENTDTNHTGTPIAAMLGICAGTFVATLVVVWRRWSRWVDLRVAWLVLIVSAIVIVNIAALDALNIMMEKDRWIEKGMPERPR